MQFNAYIAALAAAALVSLLLALYVFYQRQATGSRELAALLAAIAEWAFTIALEAAATDVAGKAFWSAVAYIGTTTAPVFLFLFALRYAQRDRSISPRQTAWLFLIPLLSTAMAFTNPWHGLLWSRITLSNTLVGVAARYARGPWFWVNVAYSYLLISAAVFTLLWAMVRFPRLYTLQTRALFVASLAPLGGNALYLLQPGTVAWVDPTPAAFLLTAAFLAVAIRRYRLLDLMPLAREILFENLQAGVLFLDAQWQIVDLNVVAQELLGLSAAAIGQPADAALAAWPPLAALLSARQDIRTEVVVGAQGERSLDVQLSLLYDRRKSTVGALMIVHDTTQCKQMEKRLLQAQKLESLSVLVAGIAHDFNNLLTAIIGNLDLARPDLPPGSPARICIDKSAQAAQRAATITRQMLAYAGQGSFVFEPVDLSRQVEILAPGLRRSVGKMVSLELQLAPELPLTLADPAQIEQVIANLVSNASEAIGEQQGVIVVATGVQDCDGPSLEQSRLEDKPPPGRFVYLQVSDTGSGMTEAVQQRMFEPFFTTRFLGRGLGLSVVLGIVRGHQGAIFVESAPGRGTAVRVLLPALEPVPSK